MASALGGCAVVVAALVGIALLVWAVVYGHRKERERTAALAALAQRRSWRFTPLDHGLANRMAGFPMFNLGHSRRGMNLMEGELTLGGLRMSLLCGDYQYKVTTSNGKTTTTTTWNMSFIAVVPLLSVPEDRTVRAEGFFDKIGAFLGMDDIDFESSEFSKRFHVQCSDRRFAFDLFDPRMMEFFLAVAPPRLHARSNCLLFDRGMRRWEAAEFEGELGWMDGFFLRVPRHVRAARLPKSEHATDPILSPSNGETR